MVTRHGQESWFKIMSTFLIKGACTNTGTGRDIDTDIIAATVTNTPISKQ